MGGEGWSETEGEKIRKIKTIIKHVPKKKPFNILRAQQQKKKLETRKEEEKSNRKLQRGVG